MIDLESRAATIHHNWQESRPGRFVAIQAAEDRVIHGHSNRDAVPLFCFTAARLQRLETSLRASARLSDDEATTIHLADLAIQAQRRRHAHEEACNICLRGQEASC